MTMQRLKHHRKHDRSSHPRHQVARRTVLLATTLALCLGFSATASAQRDLKVIPNPDPELERKTFQVAEGFEVNLYAADPLIAKPIQMNFGPDGRLWIASSEVYPHIKPGQEATDKVIVLEDKDGDGVSDKTTVFAEGLLIPTGVAPGHGGVYVANSTELLHFRDTDGDGKADEQRVVLSGFGTEDTHHILHTLRWGPEGYLYFNQSIYIHSHIETPYGVRRLNAGGIWRFRPETLELEVYARGFVNPWGHQLDRFGQSFATDGAGGEGINYVVPGAAYPTAVGVPKILHGLNPGSPKHCGLAIVDGRHLPDDWQGNLITNDFRGHRVCRFVLSEDGSGYASRQQVELIKSDHVAFRPIDVAMGPDGAIYIADWYNPIIQHGEVDFRDERRDHTHGRIWRVSRKDTPLVPQPNLLSASNDELLKNMESPESWTRQQSRRVLIERQDSSVDAAMEAWIASLASRGPEADVLRLDALWLSEARLQVQPALLAQCLASTDHRVRAGATRLVGYWADQLDQPLNLLQQRVLDEHPQVRLEAVRSLALIPNARSTEIALRALDAPTDRFLEYAIWLTCWEQRELWVPEFHTGRLSFGANPRHLTFAVKAVGDPGIVSPLVDLLKTDGLTRSQRGELLQVVASLGGPQELRLILDLASAADLPDDERVPLLNSLAAVARSRKVQPAGDVSAVGQLLDSDSAALRVAAVECLGLWQQQAFRQRFNDLAANADADLSERRAAVEAVARLGGPASVNTLAGLAAGPNANIQAQAIARLVALNPARASREAVKYLAEPRESELVQTVFQAFLSRRGAVNTLAGELAGKELSQDAAKIGMRLINESGQAQDELIAALSTAAGLKGMPRELSATELDQMLQAVRESGDPHRGEAVFRRGDLACATCHAIGGAGGNVGPDLVSIGASAQPDYLIESLLQPNKKIKENYQTLIVATDDGRVLTGIRIRQTDSDLVLRTAKGEEIQIPLASIEDQANGASIMPAGLTDKLTQAELVDLVAFLSELGRNPQFSVSSARLFRSWRTMKDTPEARFRLRRVSYDVAATDDSAFVWEPAYSLVGGSLPVDAIPAVEVRNRVDSGSRGVGFVRTELVVSTAGVVKFRLGDVTGLTAWLDEKPLTLADELEVELDRGRHRLTFAVDRDARSAPLRLELIDAPGSTAQVQPITGP